MVARLARTDADEANARIARLHGVSRDELRMMTGYLAGLRGERP